MRKDLDKQLCEDFPLLFRYRHLTPKESCMGFGFPGSGWYGIIKEAAEVIEPIISMIADKESGYPDVPYSAQVKNKLGVLRWYLVIPNNYPQIAKEEIENAIAIAEKKSYFLCESCGIEKPPPIAMVSRCDGCRRANVWL